GLHDAIGRGRLQVTPQFALCVEHVEGSPLDGPSQVHGDELTERGLSGIRSTRTRAVVYDALN
ncbi:MAG: hypothetical protein ACKPKO_61050, partial [Candidatus Fonsibacter sp.]